MKRIASQAPTSAENTAASASAPSQTGRPCSNSVGSTWSRASMPGNNTRAVKPRNTGRNANIISAMAFAPTPIRTARGLSAP